MSQQKNYLIQIHIRPTTSINLVKSAYNEAITKIDSLNDRMYKESTRILKLMKKNMELWQREVNAE